MYTFVRLISLIQFKFLFLFLKFLCFILQKGLSSKNSTVQVRAAYLQCMSSCFTSNTAHLGADVVPVLVKTIEKGASQPTQAPIVTEALAATCLLLKLWTSEGTVSEAQLSSVLPLIIDAEKQLFVSEKFLTVASDDALNNVMMLCEQLLVSHVDRLDGRTNPFHHAIIFCLTCGSPSVRAHCRTIVKKMVSSLGGTKIARALLKEFTHCLETLKIQVLFCVNTVYVHCGYMRREIHFSSYIYFQYSESRESKENKENDSGTGPGGGPEASPHTLVGCITALCSANGLMPDDAVYIAQDSLIACNHPAIGM